MPSCRVILKKLVRDKRITIDEYDKLLRNLKPQITKEDAIDYLHQIRWMQAHDKEVWRDGYDCGKNERKTGKWIEVHLSHPRYGGDAVIYRCSICGWAVDHKVPKCRCGAEMEVDE